MQAIRTAAELQALLNDSPAVSACRCSLGSCPGWTSVGEERWPAARPLATLRDAELHEPTFEERHPRGTRYDSPDAPVAVAHFPYNRSELWRCEQCRRHLLRYTEYGGYYVDLRVRELAPGLDIID